MSSIRLKPKYVKGKLPIGASKLFGTPDIFEGFEWPTIEVEDNVYDLSFICQINLKEVAKYDTKGLLPKNGMLYFFYDLDEMPYDPNDVHACKVIYHNSDDDLKSIDYLDEDGEDLSFREMKLDFTRVKEGFLASTSATHLLLGKPSLDYGFWYECIAEWQMLFQLDSFETDDICINFTDEGILCFYIDPEKLKEEDFSDVRIMQIYS